jgi:hypothetical protein
MNYILNFQLFEKQSDLKFKLIPGKGKTDVYEVIYQGDKIGLIKWVSRLRGYGYQPLKEIDVPVKDFIKKVNQEHRQKK